MKKYIEEVEETERHTDEICTHPLNLLTQQERIRIITDELIAGKSKVAIINEYTQKWNSSQKTIKNILTEAIVNLHHIHSGNTVEEMRSEQVAKLEELYKNATIQEKLKIIDLVSETLGLYNNNITVKTDDEIKINIGI